MCTPWQIYREDLRRTYQRPRGLFLEPCSPNDTEREIPMSHTSLVVLLALLLACGCEEGLAQSGDSRPTSRTTTQPANPRFPGRHINADEFAAAYVNAVNSKNRMNIEAILHFKCIALLTPEFADYYTDILKRTFRRTIPSNYRVTTTSISKVQPLPSQKKLMYPVRPTATVQIDFLVSQTKGVSITCYVVEEKGFWYLVIPFPTPHAMALMNQRKTWDQDLQDEAKQLVDQMPQFLRDEMVGLLKAGQKVEAIKRYRLATIKGLAVSKIVVEMVADQNGLK